MAGTRHLEQRLADWARLFTWNADEPIDEALFRRRLERALATRIWLGYSGEDIACRLVYAESDGLPGLIVDRYGAYLAVQLLTQGMAARAELITGLLAELVQPRGIYERSDPDMREKEGLPPGEGVLWGEPPPEQITTRQPGGLVFLADLRAGQKTGAYLDQAQIACVWPHTVLAAMCSIASATLAALA